MYNNLDVTKMIMDMRKAEHPLNRLLLTCGDGVRFGVRVKIIPYAEIIASCWIIIGVHFQQA